MDIKLLMSKLKIIGQIPLKELARRTNSELPTSFLDNTAAKKAEKELLLLGGVEQSYYYNTLLDAAMVNDPKFALWMLG